MQYRSFLFKPFFHWLRWIDVDVDSSSNKKRIRMRKNSQHSKYGHLYRYLPGRKLQILLSSTLAMLTGTAVDHFVLNDTKRLSDMLRYPGYEFDQHLLTLNMHDKNRDVDAMIDAPIHAVPDIEIPDVFKTFNPAEYLPTNMKPHVSGAMHQKPMANSKGEEIDKTIFSLFDLYINFVEIMCEDKGDDSCADHHLIKMFQLKLTEEFEKNKRLSVHKLRDRLSEIGKFWNVFDNIEYSASLSLNRYIRFEQLVGKAVKEMEHELWKAINLPEDNTNSVEHETPIFDDLMPDLHRYPVLL